MWGVCAFRGREPHRWPAAQATVTQPCQEKSSRPYKRRLVCLTARSGRYFWVWPLKLTGNPLKVPVACIRTAAMLTQTAAPSATVKSESHMARHPCPTFRLETTTVAAGGSRPGGFA